MFWKNWPYWLKGGIIVLALITLLVVILFMTGGKTTIESYKSDKISYDRAAPLYAIFMPNFLRFPLNTYSQLGALLSFMGWIAESIFLWFAVGAIAGLIYGKIKNRIKK